MKEKKEIIERDCPEQTTAWLNIAFQNCKHGVYIFNCYDGCYEEMKNGTVN